MAKTYPKLKYLTSCSDTSCHGLNHMPADKPAKAISEQHLQFKTKKGLIDNLCVKLIPKDPGRWCEQCCQPAQQPGIGSVAHQEERWPGSYKPHLQTSLSSLCTHSAGQTEKNQKWNKDSSRINKQNFSHLSSVIFLYSIWNLRYSILVLELNHQILCRKIN